MGVFEIELTGYLVVLFVECSARNKNQDAHGDGLRCERNCKLDNAKIKDLRHWPHHLYAIKSQRWSTRFCIPGKNPAGLEYHRDGATTDDRETGGAISAILL